LVFRLIPLPKKLFSLTPNAAVVPDVPTPAPNEISPVGFSSTLISITLKLVVEPILIVGSTILKIFFDLILLIDLLNKSSLNGSPSSTIKEFLITSSKVY